MTAQAKAPADLLAAATAECGSMSNISKTAKPLLSDFVAAGKFKVVDAVYDIASGKGTAV